MHCPPQARTGEPGILEVLTDAEKYQQNHARTQASKKQMEAKSSKWKDLLIASRTAGASLGFPLTPGGSGSA